MPNRLRDRDIEKCSLKLGDYLELARPPSLWRGAWNLEFLNFVTILCTILCLKDLNIP